MNVFVELLLVYLLYRFIAGFLVPIYQTTRKMRQQFHDMNNRPPAGGSGPGPANNQGGQTKNPAGESNPGTSKVGEYIDFEEVK